MTFLDAFRAYEPAIVSTDGPASLKPAAVLIAIQERTQGVLFVQRSEDLRAHGGQIGFPGGRIEAGEQPFAAALREADEEVGLASESVQYVGALDPMSTFSGYLIHPFVSTWNQRAPLVADGAEIESHFEVPADFLLEPENCRMETWTRDARERELFFWEYEGRTIWGVTGELLAAFFKIATGQPLASLALRAPSRQDEFMRRFRR